MPICKTTGKKLIAATLVSLPAFGVLIGCSSDDDKVVKFSMLALMEIEDSTDRSPSEMDLFLSYHAMAVRFGEAVSRNSLDLIFGDSLITAREDQCLSREELLARITGEFQDQHASLESTEISAGTPITIETVHEEVIELPLRADGRYAGHSELRAGGSVIPDHLISAIVVPGGEFPSFRLNELDELDLEPLDPVYTTHLEDGLGMGSTVYWNMGAGAAKVLLEIAESGGDRHLYCRLKDDGEFTLDGQDPTIAAFFDGLTISYVSLERSRYKAVESEDSILYIQRSTSLYYSPAGGNRSDETNNTSGS